MILTVAQVLREGVGGVEGLIGVSGITLSATGEQLYAVSEESSALVVFSRPSPGSDLTFVEAAIDGDSGIFGLLGASGVAASPDGRHVFVTASVDDTLAVFARDATTDSLSFLPMQVKENLVGGVVGLDGASSVTVLPDDSAVAVTGRIDDSLALFARDATTDDLVFLGATYDGVGGVDFLGGASSVVISQDSAHLYVGAFVDDAITHFHRTTLDPVYEYVSEVVDDTGGVDGIDGLSSLALSPDGAYLYATGQVDDALAVFERNQTSGALSFLTTYRDGSDGIAGIRGASSVLVNSAGDRVMVAGRDDNSVALFRRDQTTGELVFIDLLIDGVDGADGLSGVISLALSSDGEDLFVAGHDEDAIARVGVAACFGDPLTGDSDLDAICDDLDICQGDDFTGDDDGDAVCDDSDQCPGFPDGDDADGDSVPDGCDLCLGDDATGDDDNDFVCNDSDVCPGFDDGTDSDGDGVPDGCDVCLGDDSTGDSDGDGVCDDLDVCPGGDDGLDDDSDGVPNDCDVCVGDDATGDSDGDGVCDDLDQCEGFPDGDDADGDGVPDGCDLCLGDDATGDDDNDFICNDLDICPGFDDGIDSDGDGVPDGCDVCIGDDATGDSDGDGVCDDLDQCAGFPDGDDADGDGVPDGCDLCLGDDATGDDDNDFICNDLDICPGFDDGIDSDGDGVPDGCDVCVGDDATGDSDGDGVCDDLDQCVGFPDGDDADGDGIPDGCDICLGDDTTGDGDGDGLCFDLDCDDGDATNACHIFTDGFESGDTVAWP